MSENKNPEVIELTDDQGKTQEFELIYFNEHGTGITYEEALESDTYVKDAHGNIVDFDDDGEPFFVGEAEKPTVTVDDLEEEIANGNLLDKMSFLTKLLKMFDISTIDILELLKGIGRKNGTIALSILSGRIVHVIVTVIIKGIIKKWDNELTQSKTFYTVMYASLNEFIAWGCKQQAESYPILNHVADGAKRNSHEYVLLRNDLVKRYKNIHWLVTEFVNGLKKADD